MIRNEYKAVRAVDRLCAGWAASGLSKCFEGKLKLMFVWFCEGTASYLSFKPSEWTI